MADIPQLETFRIGDANAKQGMSYFEAFTMLNFHIATINGALKKLYGLSDSLDSYKESNKELIKSIRIPVATLIWYLGSNPPNGWTWFGRGGRFDIYKNPELAKIFPDGRFPNLEGAFIRLTGGNAARQLQLQEDAIRNIWGKFPAPVPYGHSDYPMGVFRASGGPWRDGRKIWMGGTTEETNRDGYGWDFSADREVPTANEVRPRNFSAGMIIRMDYDF